MDLLSTGDGSGRLDTSGVDPVKAQDYALRMFWAVWEVKFDVCKNLHNELNQDPELYQAALDAYRLECRRRGKEWVGRWKEYLGD